MDASRLSRCPTVTGDDGHVAYCRTSRITVRGAGESGIIPPMRARRQRRRPRLPPPTVHAWIPLPAIPPRHSRPTAHHARFPIPSHPTLPLQVAPPTPPTPP